jgi:hypothetical protein
VSMNSSGVWTMLLQVGDAKLCAPTITVTN